MEIVSAYKIISWSKEFALFVLLLITMILIFKFVDLIALMLNFLTSQLLDVSALEELSSLMETAKIALLIHPITNTVKLVTASMDTS